MQAQKPPKKKAVTPQLDQATAAFIEKNFPNLYKGASTLLNAMPQLFATTTSELKGQFEENELALMIDVMNGTALTPQIMGQHIASNVADGMALDGLDKKWGIERDVLNSKLKNCTIFQKAVLEIWSTGFWHGGWNESFGRTDEEFNRWVDLLK